jgi:hypothetical protein
MRTTLRRSVPPAQTIAQDMDNTAENLSVVSARDPAWLREHVLDAFQGRRQRKTLNT